MVEGRLRHTLVYDRPMRDSAGGRVIAPGCSSSQLGGKWLYRNLNLKLCCLFAFTVSGIPVPRVFNRQVLAQRMRTELDIKDRSYRFQTYKQCFLGTDAVIWLKNTGLASTNDGAEEFGNLLVDIGVISHVTRDHPFKNEKLFYRFLDDAGTGGVGTDDHTGGQSSWSMVATRMFPTTAGNHRSIQANLNGVVSRDNGMTSSLLEIGVTPLDEHNLKLLDYVHPPNWVDADGDEVYNLLVIGAGTGGLVSAAGSAGVYAKVALIENHLMGGDCLNVGCVPSK
ncbi:unnamed protein product, partial [Discosporangium mesarthrocarpum]